MEWWDVVCEISGDEGSLSPGGVSMYANVSRAGVYKRMKEGRITAFLYHEVKGVGGIFSRHEILDCFMPYTYIPGIEIRRWGEYINSRLTRDEQYLEAVGDGDHVGKFIMRTRGRKVPKDTKRWRDKTKCF